MALFLANTEDSHGLSHCDARHLCASPEFTMMRGSAARVAGGPLSLTRGRDLGSERSITGSVSFAHPYSEAASLHILLCTSQIYSNMNVKKCQISKKKLKCQSIIARNQYFIQV